MLKKWQEKLFVSDNTAITENWSSRLDESDSIQKTKRLEITYEKCARLLRNSFNVTCAILLIHAHKYQPPGGVWCCAFDQDSASTYHYSRTSSSQDRTCVPHLYFMRLPTSHFSHNCDYSITVLVRDHWKHGASISHKYHGDIDRYHGPGEFYGHHG